MSLDQQSRHGSKRERTRDQLLVSAQELLMDRTAAGLGLRQITTHAGLVHASFYNYYPDIPALIADLAELLGATHAVAMAGLFVGSEGPAVRFARITRQTLRIMAGQPGFGRLMFDVGLPADRLGAELRLRLSLDIADGAACGDFKVANVELAAAAITGAITGLALDVYRGHVSGDKIDAAAALLLTHLGVAPDASERLAHEAIIFPKLPTLPMRWLALPVPSPSTDKQA
jgi:AcrR family transcriptional regulator